MPARLPPSALRAATIVVSLATAGTAAAHTELGSSVPADGAVLGAAPAAVVLSFPEPLRVITVRLLDATGHEQPLRRDGERMAMTREVHATVAGALVPGSYRVEWRGASADGHVGGGIVRFRVEPTR